MSISRLSIAGQEDNLIRQLNTTTLKSSYTEKYIKEEPTTFIEKIQKFWAIFCLSIANRTGYGAGTADGVTRLKAERAAIKNYNSKLDDLVNFMAQNPIIEGDLANFLNVPAEPATSANDPNNKRSRTAAQLKPKIEAFYDALKSRVVQVQLKPGKKTNAEKIEHESALFQAGLQEVSKRIEKYNNAVYFDRGFIKENYAGYTEAHINNASTLVKQIALDDIRENGVQAFANALTLHMHTFGLDAETSSLMELVRSTRHQIIEKHGAKYQEALNQLASPEYVEECVKTRQDELTLKSNAIETVCNYHKGMIALKESEKAKSEKELTELTDILSDTDKSTPEYQTLYEALTPEERGTNTRIQVLKIKIEICDEHLNGYNALLAKSQDELSTTLAELADVRKDVDSLIAEQSRSLALFTPGSKVNDIEFFRTFLHLGLPKDIVSKAEDELLAFETNPLTSPTPSVLRLNIASQKDLLIRQLNTTTFKTAYTDKYINTKPATLIGRIQRFLNKIWLPIANFTGWRTGEVNGIATLAAERATIKDYNSKLDDLVAHMAENPINRGDLANFLYVAAEPATSVEDPNNKRSRISSQLQPKIEAFYKALKGRVLQLKTVNGANADTIEQQAALFQAGLQDISKRIEEHNTGYFDRGFIRSDYAKYAESHINELARNTLTELLTVEDIRENGVQAFADAIASYVHTFGLEKETTLSAFITSLRQAFYDKYGAKYNELYESLDDTLTQLNNGIKNEYFETYAEGLTFPLLQQEAAEQGKFDVLQNQITLLEQVLREDGELISQDARNEIRTAFIHCFGQAKAAEFDTNYVASLTRLIDVLGDDILGDDTTNTQENVLPLVRRLQALEALKTSANALVTADDAEINNPILSWQNALNRLNLLKQPIENNLARIEAQSKAIEKTVYDQIKKEFANISLFSINTSVHDKDFIPLVLSKLPTHFANDQVENLAENDIFDSIEPQRLLPSLERSNSPTTPIRTRPLRLKVPLPESPNGQNGVPFPMPQLISSPVISEQENQEWEGIEGGRTYKVVNGKRAYSNKSFNFSMNLSGGEQTREYTLIDGRKKYLDKPTFEELSFISGIDLPTVINRSSSVSSIGSETSSEPVSPSGLERPSDGVEVDDDVEWVNEEVNDGRF